MLRVIAACLVLVSLFTIGYLIYFFREDRKVFLDQFATRSKIIEVKAPYEERPTYKKMKFSDGKLLTVPAAILYKVQPGDSIIKLPKQHFLVWKSATAIDTIPL
jgi:hypothetical protein